MPTKPFAPTDFEPLDTSDFEPLDTPPVRNGPNAIDRFVKGATGNLLAPPTTPGEDPMSRFVSGVGSSLGRTTQAWHDMFTGNANPMTPLEMIPGVGPWAADTGKMLGTPGQRVEGAGSAFAGLAPMIGPEIPAPPVEKMAAVAKGAGKGAWEGATEMVPSTHWPLSQLPPMPAPLVGGMTGAAVGKYLGGKPGEIAGGVMGTAAPVVRGAVQGGRQALKKFKSGTTAGAGEAPPPPTPSSSSSAPPPPASPPVSAAPVMSEADRTFMDIVSNGGNPDEAWRAANNINSLKPLDPKLKGTLFDENRASLNNPNVIKQAISGEGGKKLNYGKLEKELNKSQPPPPPLASDLEKSGQVVQTGQIPVREHETNVKVDQQINNKVQNLAEYLRSKGGTAEHLDQIVSDPALTRQYLNEAHSYGKNKGNTVPKTGYKGLDPGSDTHAAVRQRILDMIEEEKNKP